MVAADTSRSRAYLQALARNQLLPNFVFILADVPGKSMPGQVGRTAGDRPTVTADEPGDEWSETRFDPTEPIRVTLDKARIPYQTLAEADINAVSVVDALRSRAESVFIYSGYGGVLLRSAVLGCGKRFLHAHGGYLPDYKGSTANYYSLIDDGTIGASAIFLSDRLDSGPILRRRKFSPPKHRMAIDHIYDPGARAKVLIETLGDYARTGTWTVESTNSGKGETYFIIHPVLKHIAILAGVENSTCE